MPKQRNHQHHRLRGPFRAGGRLQLPVAGWFGKGPYFRYPEGWETRPAPPFWMARIYLVAAAVVIVVALALGVLLTLVGGR